MASYSPVRKHEDPAIQAEFQNLYKILTALVGTGLRQILTGESTFNGSTPGRELAIPFQELPEYQVFITPVIDTTAFDSEIKVIRAQAKFTVESTFTSGSFFWAVII